MLMTKSVPGQADRTIRNYWCNSGSETAAATEWHQRGGKIKIGPECKLTIAFVSSPGLESVYANFMLRLHSKMLRVMHGPWSAAAQINILAKKVYTPWIITSGPRDGNTVNTGLTFCVSRKAGRLASVDMSHCSLSCLSCISSDPGISHGLSEAEEQLHTALRSPLRGRCALPRVSRLTPGPGLMAADHWVSHLPPLVTSHQPHTGPWLVTRSSPPHLRHP